MHSYFPLQWCLNFDKKEFGRFRVDNQNSDSSDNEDILINREDTPFAAAGVCQGPVKNMVCV